MTEIQSSAQVHLDSRLNAPPSKRASVNGMQVVTYISKGGEGHHDDYYRLFAAAAIAIGVSLQFMPRSRSVARRRGIWFYSMFDTWATETTRASLAALFRSLVGKKTIGLLFRPGDCFIERSIKSSFRRILFGVVSRLRNVHLLSIFPFAVSPEISSVATSWIYEPQLWDLQYLGVPDLQSADLVWSCYAPDYNQSSGIHGRAVQLGIPVVVRRGSYIDALGKSLSHPSL